MMNFSSMQTSDVMLSRENNLECVKMNMLLPMRGDYYMKQKRNGENWD